MLRWEELFAKVRDLQQGQERGLPPEEEEARRREFEQWVLAIAPRVMTDIRQEVELRAAELSKKSGVTVGVVGPNPEGAINPKAPWLAYLTLNLGSTLLYIYAARGGGARLSVHMVPDDGAWARKNRRVVSNAGCFVVRTKEGYELRYLRGDPEGGPKEVMPVGALVYRAFDLLVNAHVKATP
ncbi:MAG TPA: hypothetical protein VL137_16065 [Polyangiaceae bacterium]|nr:hypothetical protein [Polyangiaceae bacterium]